MSELEGSRCARCRSLNPVQAMLGPVCHACVRELHAQATGSRPVGRRLTEVLWSWLDLGLRLVTGREPAAPRKELGTGELAGLLVVGRPLRGWKLLYRDPDGELHSPTFSRSGPWRRGEWRRAECYGGRYHPGQPAPAPGCVCGGFALASRIAVLDDGRPESRLAARVGADGRIEYEVRTPYIALVEGAGHVILHKTSWETSWRAERIRLVAAWPAAKWFRRVGSRLKDVWLREGGGRMRYELWQHRRSGEIYAVALNGNGRVVMATGPLPHADLAAGIKALAENAYEPDLAADIDATQDDYVLAYVPGYR